MEQWKLVDGWPYDVSNMGRVKRAFVAPGARPGHVLKPKISKDGYRTVTLCSKGKKKTSRVARLVAAAFLGANPDAQVNHKNHNKTDDRIENLEWVTSAENRRHAVGSTLTLEEVRIIRERYATGRVMQKTLAAEFCTSESNVGRIVHGQAWKD